MQRTVLWTLCARRTPNTAFRYFVMHMLSCLTSKYASHTQAPNLHSAKAAHLLALLLRHRICWRLQILIIIWIITMVMSCHRLQMGKFLKAHHDMDHSKVCTKLVPRSLYVMLTVMPRSLTLLPFSDSLGHLRHHRGCHGIIWVILEVLWCYRTRTLPFRIV